jgi:hypothetical protein
MAIDTISTLLQDTNNKYKQTAMQELQKMASQKPLQNNPAMQNSATQNMERQNPYSTYTQVDAAMAYVCITQKYNEVMACVNAARDQLSSFSGEAVMAARSLLGAVVKDLANLKLNPDLVKEIETKAKDVIDESKKRPADATQTLKAEETADKAAKAAAQEAADKAKADAAKVAKEAEAKKAADATKTEEAQQTEEKTASMQHKPNK